MKESSSTGRRIAVIGSALGGGAAQVIDAILRGCGQVPVAIFDNNPSAKGKYILGVQVVGSSEEVIEAYSSNVFDEAIIAIGNLEVRKDIFNQLASASIPFCNVIDRDAVICDSAKIGIANVILCYSYIGPDAAIGDNCYIITGSRINHNSRIGSHCYLSTGVSIAGRVEVGNMVKFDTASGSAPDCLIPSGSYLAPGQIATAHTFPKDR
jgi:NDP-sugar pyrophosphorylase family protein